MTGLTFGWSGLTAPTGCGLTAPTGCDLGSGHRSPWRGRLVQRFPVAVAVARSATTVEVVAVVKLSTPAKASPGELPTSIGRGSPTRHLLTDVLPLVSHAVRSEVHDAGVVTG